jgi:Xaa-Pro aminopeptidase
MRLMRACLLLLLTTSAFAQDIPYFTSDFPPSEFAERRAKVAAAVGETGFAVLQGAPNPVGYERFRQTNEFYYLTGIEVAHAYLVIDGGSKRARLYLPHRNESRERSEGKVLSAEDRDLVKQLSGIEDVFGTDLLAEHLGRAAQGRARLLWTPFQPSEGLATSRDNAVRAVADRSSDPFDGRPARESHFLHLIRSRFPQFEIRDLTPTLDELRLIKSPREIAMIQKATRASSLGILEAMRSTVPNLYEYELDAVAKYVHYRSGAQGDAYYSLIASASNAWYPHYNAGKRKMLDGELVLMDYAPDIGYYMSDVTRMWPVNGKFNQWQRELYGFYLECYKAILAHIRPGVTAPTIKQEAATDMERILARAKFTKDTHAAAARTFVERYKAGSTRGGLGHWVGMATHDVGSYDGPLRPGMVFTIEPALLVPDEQIYIRLEDVLVVGETSAENITAWLPMEIDAIEAVMREEGLLQKVPVPVK